MHTEPHTDFREHARTLSQEHTLWFLEMSSHTVASWLSLRIVEIQWRVVVSSLAWLLLLLLYYRLQTLDSRVKPHGVH